MPELVYQSDMPAPKGALHRYHATPGAFERLAPPWERLRVTQRTPAPDGAPGAGLPIGVGAVLVMKLRKGPAQLTWIADHTNYQPGESFTDTARKSPFKSWTHTHRFLDGPTPDTSILRDEIDCQAPLALLAPVSTPIVRRQLDRMFAFRHDRTREDLRRIEAAGLAPGTVAVTGSTGLIGEAVCALLAVAGQRVIRLVRRPEQPRIDGTTERRWDPEADRLDPGLLGDADAVVHLAGAPLVGFPPRMTRTRWQRIVRSRVHGTGLIAEALAAARGREAVLISAGGIAALDGTTPGPDDLAGDAEDTPPTGTGPMAELAANWERATHAVPDAGGRAVVLRFGVVLGAPAGPLAIMARAFGLGLGGTAGPPDTPFPWIALDDAAGMVLHALATPELHGPLNAVAPPIAGRTASQRDLARTLAGVLHRPAFWRIPAPAVRLLLGRELAGTIAAAPRATPTRLEASGFRWITPDLESALRRELWRR